MDHRNAVFGECIDDDGGFDLGGLAERLFLFERVTLRSNRLSEIPTLARAFGVKGLIKLLNRDALRFDCNAYGIGNRNAGGNVRPFSYDVTMVVAAEQEEKGGRFLKAALKDMPELREVERMDLRNAVEPRCVRLAKDFGSAALTAVSKDLAANSPTFHAGAVLAASEIVGTKIRPEDLQLRVHFEGNTRCTVESNLLKIGLDEERAHKVIEGAILAVAGTEQKLEQMRANESVCLFRDEEVHVLQEKIRFASDQWLPNTQADRLARVLELKGFPDFSAAVAGNTLDFGRLIEARESPECLAFRQWLRSRDTVPDEEVRAEMEALPTKLGAFVRSDRGKLLRWVATCAAGAVVAGMEGFVIGAAASAMDSFLIERLFPQSGPVAFLNKSVRSILRR